MIRLLKLEDEIKNILINVPISRTDDHLLYVSYWHSKAPQISFFDFWKNYRKYKACSFVSVERCRRKLQAKYPELRDEQTADNRIEAMTDYENYAIGG